MSTPFSWTKFWRAPQRWLVMGLLFAAGAQAEDNNAPPAPVTNPGGTPPVAVPVGVPGINLNPAQAKSALAQYLALRDQLIEERRLALVQAASAPDLAAKQKILTALAIAQQDRLTQMRQFHAQVMEFNQVQRPSGRVLPAGAATP